MPSPINTPTAGVGSAVTVPTTSETVAATSGPVNADNVETGVALDATIDLSTGVGATAVTIKLERGTSAGGTAISKGGTWGPFAVAASTRYSFNVQGVDFPGLVAGQQYVVTVTQTGATGNGTVNTAVLGTTASAAS